MFHCTVIAYGSFENKMIDVSIILATLNRADQLRNMLSSLKKATKEIAYELIIIEGKSSDNTSKIIREFSPIKPRIYNEIEYFGTGEHTWPQLYNFGFSKAVGKWAMYASDDIVFSTGCFSNAVLELNKQGDKVAGGIFFYKNIPSVHQTGFRIDYTYGQKLLMNYGLLRLDYFRKVGGLDESYSFYCADGDLCLKLYEKGKQFIPLPGCFVEHFRIRDSQRISHGHTSNADIKRYKDRWKHFVDVSKIGPRHYFGASK